VIANNKYAQLSFTKQIKDRDLEITGLNEKLKAIENFKSEKDNFQKIFFNLTNDLKSLKDEVEKKNHINKSLKKQNNELKRDKKQNTGNLIVGVEEKSNLTWNNMSIPWKILIKEKDKKILLLEKENNKLQNEIDRLNRDMQNLKTGSIGKIKISCLPNEISNINSYGNDKRGNKEKLFISSLGEGNSLLNSFFLFLK